MRASEIPASAAMVRVVAAATPLLRMTSIAAIKIRSRVGTASPTDMVAARSRGLDSAGTGTYVVSERSPTGEIDGSREPLRRRRRYPYALPRGGERFAGRAPAQRRVRRLCRAE